MAFEGTIRRAIPTDAAIVAEYNRRLALETEETTLEMAILLPGVEAALADEAKALYFVAEANGAVVGQCMITFEWSDWRNGVVWWFQSVYVAEGWRQRGVFRALFERVLEEGEQAGVVGIRLYVHSENEAAQETYRRLGLSATHYLLMERVPL
jgi:ribosomal protein S18 acetylase RimI-like enzyme